LLYGNPFDRGSWMKNLEYIYSWNKQISPRLNFNLNQTFKSIFYKDNENNNYNNKKSNHEEYFKYNTYFFNKYKNDNNFVNDKVNDNICKFDKKNNVKKIKNTIVENGGKTELNYSNKNRISNNNKVIRFINLEHSNTNKIVEDIIEEQNNEVVNEDSNFKILINEENNRNNNNLLCKENFDSDNIEIHNNNFLKKI